MSQAGPTHGQDWGLHRERTSLAWRRLEITLLALSLAALRLTWPILGAWALVPSAALIAGAVALLHGTQLRHSGSQPTPRPDGRLLAATAITAACTALFALFIVSTDAW